MGAGEFEAGLSEGVGFNFISLWFPNPTLPTMKVLPLTIIHIISCSNHITIFMKYFWKIVFYKVDCMIPVFKNQLWPEELDMIRLSKHKRKNEETEI